MSAPPPHITNAINQPTHIVYKPAGPVATAFLQSTAFVRGIMGPIGSGKSTACVLEILRRSQAQAPGPDGIRRTRWAIIRNSFPELRTTTLKTWGDWCPPQYGRLTFDSPIRHHVQTRELDMEVLFMALDREDDVKKLLSLELTGGWINEAREVPKAILDGLTGRVGRYPSKNLGGCSWSGILMDTNPPDDQSWWFTCSERDVPKDWEFFRQPSGESPEAENVENLPPNYYDRIRAGKDPDWVKVYIRAEYGFVTEGKAVYPMFRDRIHVATGTLDPIPGLPLLLGADFGLTPAAVIGQRSNTGRWLILDELCASDCGVIRFAELLNQYVKQHFPGFEVGGAWGDPAGGHRTGHDERTAFDIMNTHTPWRWRSAPTNDFMPRREVVIAALNRLIDGDPGLLISSKASTLRAGFAGKYHFRLNARSGGGTLVSEVPAKNAASHPHDALQYLLLGGGEYDASVRKKPRKAKLVNGVYVGESLKRVAKDVDYNILG